MTFNQEKERRSRSSQGNAPRSERSAADPSMSLSVTVDKKYRSRTPSPEVIKKVGIRYLGGGQGAPVYTTKQRDSAVKTPKDSKTTEIFIRNRGKDLAKEFSKFPFGMKVESVHDDHNYVRHLILIIPGNSGPLTPNLAKQMGLKDRDEILMVDGVCVVNMPHFAAVEAFGKVQIGRAVHLTVRRVIKEGREPVYEYYEVSGTVGLHMTENKEPVIICVNNQQLTMEPGANGLYNVVRTGSHQARVACADNATYWRVKENTVGPSSEGLNGSKEYKFSVFMYQGFGRVGNPVNFYVIGYHENGVARILTAVDDTTLKLQGVGDGTTSLQSNPEADICFKVSKTGQMYTLESLKYPGKYVNRTTPSLTLGNSTKNEETLFYIYHDDSGCRQNEDSTCGSISRTEATRLMTAASRRRIRSADQAPVINLEELIEKLAIIDESKSSLTVQVTESRKRNVSRRLSCGASWGPRFGHNTRLAPFSDGISCVPPVLRCVSVS